MPGRRTKPPHSVPGGGSFQISPSAGSAYRRRYFNPDVDPDLCSVPSSQTLAEIDAVEGNHYSTKSLPWKPFDSDYYEPDAAQSSATPHKPSARCPACGYSDDIDEPPPTAPSDPLLSQFFHLLAFHQHSLGYILCKVFTPPYHSIDQYAKQRITKFLHDLCPLNERPAAIFDLIYNHPSSIFHVKGGRGIPLSPLNLPDFAHPPELPIPVSVPLETRCRHSLDNWMLRKVIDIVDKEGRALVKDRFGLTRHLDWDFVNNFSLTSIMETVVRCAPFIWTALLAFGMPSKQGCRGSATSKPPADARRPRWGDEADDVGTSDKPAPPKSEAEDSEGSDDDTSLCCNLADDKGEALSDRYHSDDDDDDDDDDDYDDGDGDDGSDESIDDAVYLDSDSDNTSIGSMDINAHGEGLPKNRRRHPWLVRTLNPPSSIFCNVNKPIVRWLFCACVLW